LKPVLQDITRTDAALFFIGKYAQKVFPPGFKNSAEFKHVYNALLKSSKGLKITGDTRKMKNIDIFKNLNNF
jgi:hypothetical protein